jgi:hypothetical protein
VIRDRRQGRVSKADHGFLAHSPEAKSIVEEDRHHVLERVPAATGGTHAAISNKSYIDRKRVG